MPFVHIIPCFRRNRIHDSTVTQDIETTSKRDAIADIVGWARHFTATEFPSSLVFLYSLRVCLFYKTISLHALPSDAYPSPIPSCPGPCHARPIFPPFCYTRAEGPSLETVSIKHLARTCIFICDLPELTPCLFVKTEKKWNALPMLRIKCQEKENVPLRHRRLLWSVKRKKAGGLCWPSHVVEVLESRDAVLLRCTGIPGSYVY